MKKGSALRKAVVIIAVIAVLAGAMFGARAVINGKRSVGVIHVMDIADTWIDYSSQGYGQISQGGIQQVWNDTSMLISKIYVSEGDRVKKGDPLIQYDTAQAELRADDRRIEYEMAKRDLSNAQERLAYIKTFRPNQKPEPELKLYQDPVDIAVDEDGKIIVISGQRSVLEEKDEDSRKIIIDVNLDTPVTRQTFETLLNYDPDAILPEPDTPGEVPGQDGEPAQQDPEDPSGPADPGEEDVPEDPEPAPSGKEVQPQREFVFRIWANCPGMDSVQIASVSNRPEEDGIPRERWLSLYFAHEEGEEEPVFTFSEVYSVDDFSGKIDEDPNELIKPVFSFKKERSSAEVPETERYTQSEINRMLQEQNALVRDLKIEVAQAELDWREAKQSAGDGIVRAAHDGVVVSVRDPYSLGRDEPMIQVSSGEGYQIVSTISEMQLQEVKVGDHISVMMWSNGMTYDGTIVKISPYPTQYSMSYSSGGNMSYYQFTADLDCQDELQPWDGGEIQFGETQKQGDTFAIEACFVREENGRSYVLASDEEDRLYKKYVEIGRILYGGWSVEITGGLSLDDYIAFPYGKNAVVGAKADRDAEVYKW